MKYPKRSQYKYAKSPYRIGNWPEYEAGVGGQNPIRHEIMALLHDSNRRTDPRAPRNLIHPAAVDFLSFECPNHRIRCRRNHVQRDRSADQRSGLCRPR